MSLTRLSFYNSLFTAPHMFTVIKNKQLDLFWCNRSKMRYILIIYYRTVYTLAISLMYLQINVFIAL